MTTPALLPIIRCNGGVPIIAPSSNWWETGVTFNPAAVYLERSPANDPILRALLPMRRLDDPALAEGVVAVFYRARPEVDSVAPFVRSFIGLALFTPSLEPLYRYQEPVLVPSPDPQGPDTLGIEDPRVTRVGDTFVMIYCGLAAHPQADWRAALCMAYSKDLLHWQKAGPIPGDVNRMDNKDGVLFPGPHNGHYYLLHRPFGAGLTPHETAIRLAMAPALEGPYEDLGELLRAFPNPGMQTSWVGAGSVPIDMGHGRYALIYHTGNRLPQGQSQYDLDAALFDFDRLDPHQPARAITGRIEPLMTPETPAELRSESALQVSNVLFACGSYEYRDDVYVIYGGADTYTLAARVERQAFFRALERAGLENPFLPAS